MKLLFSLSLSIAIVACSESPPEATSSDTAPPINNNAEFKVEADVIEKQPSAAEIEAAAELEASILSSAQLFSNQQSTANEQVSVKELEDLSAADREALSDRSAKQTARDAEQKALRQAEAAAEQVID